MLHCSCTCTLKTFLGCATYTMELFSCSGSFYGLGTNFLNSVFTWSLPADQAGLSQSVTGLGKSLDHAVPLEKREEYFSSPPINGLLGCPVCSRKGLYSTLHTSAGFCSGCRGNPAPQGATEKAGSKTKAMACKGGWDQFKKGRFPEQTEHKGQTQPLVFLSCRSSSQAWGEGSTASPPRDSREGAAPPSVAVWTHGDLHSPQLLWGNPLCSKSTLKIKRKLLRLRIHGQGELKMSSALRRATSVSADSFSFPSG